MAVMTAVARGVFSVSTRGTRRRTPLVVVAILTLVFLSCLFVEKGHATATNKFEISSSRYSRDDFPPQFVFGSGTSAYQVEGAAAEDGRSPSIWDTAAHTGKVIGNGDIACDQYHKYKEDVQLIAETGLEAYRFSISWSRLIPKGRGPVNPKGLEYYNNLINELVNHGIQPHVTLFHYDLPQVLEDEYGGFLSRKIVDDFAAYADVCFKEFGNRVAHWTTINEVNFFVLQSYDYGYLPPNHCSAPFGVNCTRGNSILEPYIVAHNCLLAHASAAKLYKKKYQNKQHGFIGLNIYSIWFIPRTNKTEDVIATQRVNAFYAGWFIDPLIFGRYPDIVKNRAGSKLPSFTPHEAVQVQGSYDFIGLNHYTTGYVKDAPNSFTTYERDVSRNIAANITFVLYGGYEFPISYSSGMQSSLEYFKQNYGNPPIYIHENGQATPQNASLNDTTRVEYLDGYIGSLFDALRNGSNARGYFTWSFLDLYELLSGYELSYGLYYVDRNDPDLKRNPKLSAHWYSNFLRGGNMSKHRINRTEKLIYTYSQASHIII